MTQVKTRLFRGKEGFWQPMESSRKQAPRRLARTRFSGTDGSIIWHWHAAVVLEKWAIVRQENGVWLFTGVAKRVDTYAARHKPLVFTVPKVIPYWPVESLEVVSNQVRGTLGQPEHQG